jgi:hypothetical protein
MIERNTPYLGASARSRASPDTRSSRQRQQLLLAYKANLPYSQRPVRPVTNVSVTVGFSAKTTKFVLDSSTQFDDKMDLLPPKRIKCKSRGAPSPASATHRLRSLSNTNWYGDHWPGKFPPVKPGRPCIFATDRRD